MSNERLPWVPYYPAMLLGALAGMTSDQQLVYQTVLLRIYDVCGPCPDGPDALARRCRINKRRVLEALDALFKAGKLYREGDAVMNPFAAKLLADREAIRRDRQRAGSEGGKRRAENLKTNQSRPPSNGQAKPSDLDSDLEVEEEPKIPGLAEEANPAPTRADLERDLFRRGKQVLGKSAGGMIQSLLKSREFDVALARAVIETAATKQDAREYVAGAIKNGGDRGKNWSGRRPTEGRSASALALERFSRARDERS